MNKKGHVLNAILLAIGLAYILQPAGDVETFVTIAELFVPLVLGALFPDVDTAFGKHRKTLHNLPVLAVIVAYPIYFGNLQFVWIGVATHYLLDVVGSKRGIALFYPLSSTEYGLPIGVTTSSKWADAFTVVITLAELAALALLQFFVVDLNTGTPREAVAAMLTGLPV
ncbi:metal-dependent hydrolase [Halobaculum sp. CBA1158]|uniref:metal-dependent hydrolase n=1 Tax=Halobaculum sp. CBA1158 TaxID=2904243 RepID=UPI001F17BDB1|nr:metal-dependent hydrolase [Halobaculum sp. CBA1158]UIP00220.1 metal-dependent hydrolase [Halobaculum sp. CBA1158]